MAKRKKKPAPKVEPRPNKFASWPDDDLEDEYRTALGEYAARMEYFDSLPAWMHDDFKSIHEQGPENWGLTRGEWDAYVLDRWHHICEGERLSDIRTERLRRLSAASRAVVEACADLESAEAVLASYALPQGPRCYGKTPEESFAGYMARTEAYDDAHAEHDGASDGMFAVYEREVARRREEALRRCGLRD